MRKHCGAHASRSLPSKRSGTAECAPAPPRIEIVTPSYTPRFRRRRSTAFRSEPSRFRGRRGVCGRHDRYSGVPSTTGSAERLIAGSRELMATSWRISTATMCCRMGRQIRRAFKDKSLDVVYCHRICRDEITRAKRLKERLRHFLAVFRLHPNQEITTMSASSASRNVKYCGSVTWGLFRHKTSANGALRKYLLRHVVLNLLYRWACAVPKRVKTVARNENQHHHSNAQQRAIPEGMHSKRFKPRERQSSAHSGRWRVHRRHSANCGSLSAPRCDSAARLHYLRSVEYRIRARNR